MSKGIKNYVNFGYSSRLPYDGCAYDDRLHESTGPLKYVLDPNRIYNCDACLSTLGPRSGNQGYGVSMPTPNKPAVSQDGNMVDIESILSNRNVPSSRCRKNGLNPIDVTKFKVIDPKVCNSFLNPLSSRLTNPPATYRDAGINRFYNLNKNPQLNIYWDAASNSVLEATDNFNGFIPQIWADYPSLPQPIKGKNTCQRGKNCPIQGLKRPVRGTK
jgi:hypothetical protein